MSNFKLANKADAKAKPQSKTETVDSLLSQAAAEHFYWDVKNDEKIFHNRMVISGAEARWKKFPDYVYVPEYRVSGTAADVEWFMDQIDVDDYFMYNSDDLDNEDFKREVEAYKEHQDAQKEADAIGDETYQTILDNLHSLHFHNPKKESSGNNYKNPRGRYDSIDSEHVLDVSHRDNVGDKDGEKVGKGSAIVLRADPNLPNNHVQGPATIRIVSNNAVSYEAELRAIGKWTDAEIKAALAKWQINFDAAQTRKKKALVLTAGIRPPARRLEKK